MNIPHRSFSFALPLLLATSLVGVTACGASASSNAPNAEPGQRHHGPEEEHGRHGHQFEGGLKSFHDVLAPVWHQDKGLARVDGACDKASSLSSLARSLETDPPPAGAASDEAGWKTDAHELVLAADALEPACAAEGRTDVEARLTTLHDAFHALLARTKRPHGGEDGEERDGGEHGEHHGEGEHHD
jgi:hypothetical protein